MNIDVSSQSLVSSKSIPALCPKMPQPTSPLSEGPASCTQHNFSQGYVSATPAQSPFHVKTSGANRMGKGNLMENGTYVVHLKKYI